MSQRSSRVLFALILGGLAACSSSPEQTRLPDAINDDKMVKEIFPAQCTPDKKTCVHFSPTEMPIHAVREALQGARRRIRMLSYSLNIMDYVDIINEKMARGVQVEIVNDFRNSFDPKDEMRLFKRRGGGSRVSVYRIPNLRGRSPQMHNKVLVIDDELVVFGSANFTYNGLVANYENMMAVRDRDLVVRFNDEIDEMIASSKAACETFYDRPAECGTGNERNDGWDQAFTNYARCGNSAWALPVYDQTSRTWQPPSPATVNRENAQIQDASCRLSYEQRTKLRWEAKECFGIRFGAFNSANLPNVPDLGACFEDGTVGAKWGALAKAYAENERYVRDSATTPGVLTSSDPPKEKPAYRHQSRQSGPFQVWFSPEDDAETALVNALKSAAASPAESFVLVSTNFVTNKTIADALVDLHSRRVRVMEVFFDRGRWEDPNFRSQRARLQGFVTSFDNQLSGSYGSNHNKMAVVYTPRDGLVLLNGSANWSGGAMDYNDENFAIIRHEETALIYLKEILSQLFVYKYGHNLNDPKLQETLKFVLSRPRLNANCLKALMAWKNEDGTRVTECRTRTGQTWKPVQLAPAVIGIRNVPFARENTRMWAWVPQLRNNQGAFVEAFNGGDSFAGKWVVSIPVPPGWDFQFKFFRGGKSHVPSPGNFSGLSPEYGGMNNDRRQKSADMAFHTVFDAHMPWGQAPQ